MKWAGHIARMEEGRSAFKILTIALAGKRPVGRTRRRWRAILEWFLNKYEELGGFD